MSTINTSFPVSWSERNPTVQSLIDESFQMRVLPLHKDILAGYSMNYMYFGSKEYSFDDAENSVAGITSSKIAEEFAAKERFAVLDLGTGNGLFLHGMKERFSNVDVLGVSAMDFRPTSKGLKEVTIPDDEYVVGNIENLNQLPELQDRKFDFIVAAITIRHLSDPLGFLCQAYEKLEPNGILIVDDFKLNGLSGMEYLSLFETNTSPEVEILPLCERTIAGKAYCIPFDKPSVTKIRKTVEHLILPVSYDLENSTKATDMEQAQIFYKITI